MKHSPERVAQRVATMKIKGYQHSPETRAKIGATQRDKTSRPTCPNCGDKRVRITASSLRSGKVRFRQFRCGNCSHNFSNAVELHITGSVAERFWPRVDKGDGCWRWTGAIDTHGYGRFSHNPGGSGQAHRVAYTLAVGPIPPGLTIDHLCRNKRCVNPAHLEVVTLQENIRRMRVKRPNVWALLDHILWESLEGLDATA